MGVIQVAELERRAGVLKGIEVRQDTDDGPVIAGYAAVFNQASVDLGGFTEVIRPGAFANVLERGDDIVALWNHDVNYVLGRVSNGTLALYEDEIGLRYEVRPRRGGWIDDLIESIRRRDVQGNSFSFHVAENGEKWTKRDDGSYLREITRVAELRDVGPVTLPAYPQTVVVARSVVDKARSLRAQDLHNNRDLALRAQSLDVELKIEELEGSRYVCL